MNFDIHDYYKIGTSFSLTWLVHKSFEVYLYEIDQTELTVVGKMWQHTYILFYDINDSRRFKIKHYCYLPVNSPFWVWLPGVSHPSLQRNLMAATSESWGQYWKFIEQSIQQMHSRVKSCHDWATRSTSKPGDLPGTNYYPQLIHWRPKQM